MIKIKNKFRAVWEVLSELVWRSFGIFLFILGSSAGVGAALTGSWLNGVLVGFGTLMLGLISAIGYAIAVSGKATRQDVAKAAQDAIQKVMDKDEK